MSAIDKKLKSMENNPKGDWAIEDLKSIADRYAIIYRQTGTSHVTFRSSCGEMLTVPAHKPIKAIYIKKFIDLIKKSKGKEDG